MTGFGHMYTRLQQAVAHSGVPRSVYSQDATLSRRGLLTRANKRARELAGLGVGAGDLVGLCVGNVAEMLVLLLATSRLRAIAAIVDPTRGDRALLQTAARLPLRAVLRRPRGSAATDAIDYGPGYRVTSRRRVAGTLLSIDVLQPPGPCRPAIPAGTELMIEARGIGGVVRDVALDRLALAAVGTASANALSLDPGDRLLCAQPLCVPRFFVPAVLGWLASEAQLVMGEGLRLPALTPLCRAPGRLLVLDSAPSFVDLSRAAKASGAVVPLCPVVAEAAVPTGLGGALRKAFGDPGRQLLYLEELGLLAARPLVRGEPFAAATGVSLGRGAKMACGGLEVLARVAHDVETVPPTPATHPGSLAADGLRHTGYAGRFSKGGALTEIVGRDDGLVYLEGRRACLDQIEAAIMEHRRVRSVRANVCTTADGEPEVHVEFRATGQTDLEDLDEHLVAQLPPHMVPRKILRIQ